MSQDTRETAALAFRNVVSDPPKAVARQDANGEDPELKIEIQEPTLWNPKALGIESL